MEIIKINRDELFTFLSGLTTVTGEYELLKKFTPELNDNGISYSMYERHFSVYHALYLLKSEAGASGIYLHIDPVLIRLKPVPPAGLCGHYTPATGDFCMRPAAGPFCEEHSNFLDPAIPYFDPMARFYLDPENISFGESEILDNMLKGFKLYCLNRREIDRALILFDIEKPDRNKICRSYRKLASKFHPDRNDGSEERMKEINSAYSLLKEVFVI